MRAPTDFVVVAEMEGDLVQLYRGPGRPHAKAAATTARALGVPCRILPADRLRDVEIRPNPSRSRGE